MPTGRDDYDVIVKIILLGNQGTGKSSLLRRYVADEFIPEGSRATNGVKFSTRVLRIDGKRVKGQIWDTQGFLRAHTLVKPFIKGVFGAMLVFDIGEGADRSLDKGPLEVTQQYLRDVRELAGTDPAIMLVGNKSDLGERRVVPADAGKAFAAEEGILFVEASAADGTNVDLAFDVLISEAYFAMKQQQQQWKQQQHQQESEE